MYLIPQKEIEIENAEPRTATNGSRYYLVTDTSGESYGDWRDGRKLYGDFPLLNGQKYKIEFTISKDGKYKNVKSAFKI